MHMQGPSTLPTAQSHLRPRLLIMICPIWSQATSTYTTRQLTSSESSPQTRRRGWPPFCDKAADLCFSLLNTPGTYTRIPLSSSYRYSAIDLAFANSHLFPEFGQWDATSLPSTGSDHVPILVPLQPPTHDSLRPTPRWQDTDWSGLEKTLDDWRTPPPRKTLSQTTRPLVLLCSLHPHLSY